MAYSVLIIRDCASLGLGGSSFIYHQRRDGQKGAEITSGVTTADWRILELVFVQIMGLWAGNLF